MDQVHRETQPEVTVTSRVITQDGTSFPIYQYPLPVINLYPPIPDGLLRPSNSQVQLPPEPARLVPAHYQPVIHAKALHNAVDVRSLPNNERGFYYAEKSKLPPNDDSVQGLQANEERRDQSNLLKGADVQSYFLPKHQSIDHYKPQSHVIYRPVPLGSETIQQDIGSLEAMRNLRPNHYNAQRYPETSHGRSQLIQEVQQPPGTTSKVMNNGHDAQKLSDATYKMIPKGIVQRVMAATGEVIQSDYVDTRRPPEEIYKVQQNYQEAPRVPISTQRVMPSDYDAQRLSESSHKMEQNDFEAPKVVESNHNSMTSNMNASSLPTSMRNEGGNNCDNQPVMTESAPAKPVQPSVELKYPSANLNGANEHAKSTTLPKVLPESSAGAPSCYWKEMWHKLNNMRALWQLCDISLFSSDNYMFMAHSPVLAASSDLLHAYFVSHSAPGVRKIDDKKIMIERISGAVLQVTIDFIYGIFPTDQEQLESLVEGAEVLGIKGAVGFVQHVKRIDSAALSKCPVMSRRAAEMSPEQNEVTSDEHVIQQSRIVPPPTVINYSMKDQTPTTQNDLPNDAPKCSTPLNPDTPRDPHELLDMTGSPPPQCPMHKLLQKDRRASMTDYDTASKEGAAQSNTNLLGMLGDEGATTSNQKCPFGFSKDTKKPGSNELLTEITLQDLYPQLNENDPERVSDNGKESLSVSLESEQVSSKGKRKQISLSDAPDTSLQKFAKSSPVDASGKNNDSGSERENASWRDKRTVQERGEEDGLPFSGDENIDSDDAMNEGNDDDEGTPTDLIIDDDGCTADVTTANRDCDSSPDVKKKSADNEVRQRVKQESDEELLGSVTSSVDKTALAEMEKIIKKLEKKKGALGTGKASFKCLVPECPYSNRMLGFVLSHMHRCHGIGQPTRMCTLCDHAYFSESQLRNHLRRAHGLKSDEKITGQDKKPEFLCQTCGQTFRAKQTLHMHQLKVHQKGAIYSCDDCEFKTPRKKDMQVHLLSRHDKLVPGVQVYICKYCPYKCLDRGRYDEHEAKHTGTQKFLCPICGKAYTTRRGMRTHIAYHKEDRPHKCSICKAGFKVRGKLNDHMRLMHLKVGEKPYQCGYCNHRTALRGNCNQHVKKYHPDLPVCVIDTHAGKREPVHPYYYKNYTGPNIEVRKDVSSACYKAIGGASPVRLSQISDEELPVANKDALAGLPDEPNVIPDEKVPFMIDIPTKLPENGEEVLVAEVSEHNSMSELSAGFTDTRVITPSPQHQAATDQISIPAQSQKCPFITPDGSTSVTGMSPSSDQEPKCPYSMATMEDLTMSKQESDGSNYNEISNLKAL